MRLWSLHPSYLDTKGLIALWREALLAQAVLRGKTRGYRHHPQLDRFRSHVSPRRAIAAYLWHVHVESGKREHSFDRQKVRRPTPIYLIPVAAGQVEYEARRLLEKLKVRDRGKYEELRSTTRLRVHPIFRRRPGSVEAWERT